VIARPEPALRALLSGSCGSVQVFRPTIFCAFVRGPSPPHFRWDTDPWERCEQPTIVFSENNEYDKKVSKGLLGAETQMPSPSHPFSCWEIRERLYESGNCVQRICALLGVHPKDAQRPSGVQNQPVLRRFSRVTSIEFTSGVSGRTKYIRLLGTAAALLLPGSTRIAGFGRDASSRICPVPLPDGHGDRPAGSVAAFSHHE